MFTFKYSLKMQKFVIIVLLVECVIGMSLVQQKAKMLPKRTCGSAKSRRFGSDYSQSNRSSLRCAGQRQRSLAGAISTTNENITVPNNFKNNYGPIFNSTNGNGDTYNLDLNNNNNLNNLNNTTITIINYFKCDDLFKKSKKSSENPLKSTLLRQKKK